MKIVELHDQNDLSDTVRLSDDLYARFDGKAIVLTSDPEGAAGVRLSWKGHQALEDYSLWVISENSARKRAAKGH
jgi:hypothetical protein